MLCLIKDIIRILVLDTTGGFSSRDRYRSLDLDLDASGGSGSLKDSPQWPPRIL